MARALVILGERDDADGQAWHLPAAEPLTGRQFLELVFAEAGHPPETLRVGLHCFGFLGDDVEQATSASYPGWAAMFTQVSRERGFPPPSRRQFDATRGPEKSLAELDPDWLLKNFTVNTVGPAIVAKHFLPLFPVDRRAVFAVLSARVGSIGDNKLGGWYGYRASKAALNQLVRTLSIEEKRRNDRSIVVALHPGTVDTPLSQPFQANVRPDQLFAPDRAAVQLLDVLDGLKAPDSGKHFGWDGAEIAP